MIAPRLARVVRAASALAAAAVAPAWGEPARPVAAMDAPKVATAPGTAAADPVERLRQRLAERLVSRNAVTPPTEGVPVTDIRLTPKAAAGAAPQAGREGDGTTAPRARASRVASAAPTPRAAASAPHWGYEGAGGPAAWGALRPEFGLCARGQRQSPIDIRDGLAVDLAPVQFHYQPGGFAVIDNGHTVQVNVAPGSAIELGGRRFELQQFHFHRPSEERIDGRQFEMSVHLVHRDPQGRLAVVAVLLQAGPAQPVVQTVWNHLPLEKHEEQTAPGTLDPSGLLPLDRRYYTYMGSLTTPPCSEGVQWVVMRTPVGATPEQIELFGRLYPMNARPLQEAAGRRILQSN